MKMPMNIIFFALLVCYFTPPKNATPTDRLQISSGMLFGKNGCPITSGRFSPEITDSPFLVGTDAVDRKGNKDETIIVAPISRNLFNKLELVVLPNREICVLGEKINSLRLPYQSEFEIMTGIAIWFSPCTSRPTHVKRVECLNRKMKSINDVDITIFQNLHDFLVAALQEI